MKGEIAVDPVLVGAVMTVLVSLVSGVVKLTHRWLEQQVELARIAEAGLTERVRSAVSRGAIQESTQGHEVWAVVSSARGGGGCDGGCRRR